MRPALILFAFGLLLRILFWQATPDRDLAYAACYQGDAPYWQALAQAADRAPDRLPTELRIPLRPPGMHWLVSTLWNGDPATAWRLRLLFAVLGAMVAPLLFLALRRWLDPGPAMLAGGICAASTGLLQLGSGIHGEIPYLLLFLLTMLDWHRLRAGAAAWVVARWAALHALACLVRAEHVLVLVGMLGLLWLPPAPRRIRSAVVALATFAAVLLPWQLRAASAIGYFNTQGGELPARSALPWQPAARAAIERLPAFLRPAAFGFVEATVRYRGGSAVNVADVGILAEAYGPVPGPFATPFVALYGPLNFFLANSAEADGGFTQAPLDRPPPLTGGRDRYPPDWLANAPRDGQLSLSYPPHVQRMQQGYRLGWDWIVANPGAAVALAGRKLQFFWQGAASGVGGYAVPLGLSGTRRRVDLTTAEGIWPTTFRLLVLLVGVLGVWCAGRRPEVWPWLWFLLTKVAVTLAFFGYARHGALCVPVLAILAALIWQQFRPGGIAGRRWSVLGWSLVALVAVMEVVRWVAAPVVLVDDRPVGPGDPFPPMQFEVRAVRYR